jgi:hypothetical protein
MTAVNPHNIRIGPVVVPEEFRQAVEAKASVDGTTVSTVVRRLLVLWLAGEVAIAGVAEPAGRRPPGRASPNYPGNS